MRVATGGFQVGRHLFTLRTHGEVGCAGGADVEVSLSEGGLLPIALKHAWSSLGHVLPRRLKSET